MHFELSFKKPITAVGSASYLNAIMFNSPSIFSAMTSLARNFASGYIRLVKSSFCFTLKSMP